jgi:methionyl-tRNA formyltransferase
MGYEVFIECKNVLSANYRVMTLSNKTKVVMYDGVDTKKWYNVCDNVIEIESIRQSHVVEKLKQLNLDLIIMCGWRQVIDEEILNIPKLGTVAFHPTPLPKGRGPAPIIHTVLQGWKKSAVTLFFPDGGIDSGDIIDQKYFDIHEEDYAADVYEKCINASKNLLSDNLHKIIKGTANRKKQNNSHASYLKKLTIKDNEIDLNGCPEEAYRKIKAFSTPYLGAYIRIGNKKIVVDRGRVCTKIKKY